MYNCGKSEPCTPLTIQLPKMSPEELEKNKKSIIQNYVKTAKKRYEYIKEHNIPLQPLRLINYCGRCPVRIERLRALA
jgi:hypothetical protein